MCCVTILSTPPSFLYSTAVPRTDRVIAHIDSHGDSPSHPCWCCHSDSVIPSPLIDEPRHFGRSKPPSPTPVPIAITTLTPLTPAPSLLYLNSGDLGSHSPTVCVSTKLCLAHPHPSRHPISRPPTSWSNPLSRPCTERRRSYWRSEGQRCRR